MRLVRPILRVSVRPVPVLHVPARRAWRAKARHPRLSSVPCRQVVDGGPSPAMTGRAGTAAWDADDAGATRISVTAGRPSVSVPVLSSTTVSTGGRAPAPRRRGSGCRRGPRRRCRPSARPASPARGRRAGDHQHRDRGDQRPPRSCRRSATSPSEGDQRRKAARPARRPRHPVDQALHRRLVRLGALDQGDDAGQRAVGADRRDVRTRSRPSPLIAPPVTRSPGCFVHRKALAGKQALVDLAARR